jgi:hypothetical protein
LTLTPPVAKGSFHVAISGAYVTEVGVPLPLSTPVAAAETALLTSSMLWARNDRENMVSIISASAFTASLKSRFV